MTEAMPSDDFVVSFATTEDARAWLIDRVAYLAGVAGQQGSPRVSFSPDPPSGLAFCGAWGQRNVLLTGENGGVEARFTPSRKDTS